MKFMWMLVLPVVLLSGCQSGASQATIDLMDATTKQSIELYSVWSAQKDNVVASMPTEQAMFESAIADISGTLQLISLGCQNFNAALQAKSSLSVNSASKISDAVATLETLKRVMVQFGGRITAKDEAQKEAIEVWKMQCIENTSTLIMLFNRLDSSVQTDLAKAQSN